MGDVPDGAWTVARIVSEYLSRNAVPEDQLAAFLRLASEAAQHSVPDLDALAARTESEAPALAGLLALLRDPATAGVIGIVGLLFAVVFFLVQQSDQQSSDVTVIVNQSGEDEQHHHEEEQRGHVGPKGAASGENTPADGDDG